MSALDPKSLATYQARAAIAGCSLIRTDDDRGRAIYVMTMGAVVVTLDDAEEIDEFLATIGANLR